MNPQCTQKRKLVDLKRASINLNSKQEMHKYVKIRNTPTSFPHIVMQIMQGISTIDAQSTQHFISSMAPSLTGAPINSLKPLEAVQIQKQEQYTQGC